MKRLILNADDYGLSPAVSTGIREAARTVVRSTTVMANLATADDLRSLKRSGLHAGVHLNLSCGPPLSRDYPRALLSASGDFRKTKALDPRTWEERAALSAAREEWERQLDALRSAGIAPDHLDSHHHVHLFEPLFPQALALARRHGLALRTATLEQREQARKEGLRTPDELRTDFYGNNHIDRAALLMTLARAREGVVEVLCHPGRVDGALKQRSSYVDERARELATLADTSLAVELERNGWTLVSYTTAW